MRRASASIAANLAEGCGRRSDGEMGRFIQIAMGSGAELSYHLLLAKDLGLIEDELYQGLDSDLGNNHAHDVVFVAKGQESSS